MPKTSWPHLALALLPACACPASGERFVPGPDPDNFVQADAELPGILCADGEVVDMDEATADYYVALCRCDWCADSFGGRDYCVRREVFDDWASESCRGCNIKYHEFTGNEPLYVEVRCNSPDCSE